MDGSSFYLGNAGLESHARNGVDKCGSISGLGHFFSYWGSEINARNFLIAVEGNPLSSF